MTIEEGLDERELFPPTFLAFLFYEFLIPIYSSVLSKSGSLFPAKSLSSDFREEGNFHLIPTCSKTVSSADWVEKDGQVDTADGTEFVEVFHC